MCLPIWEFLFDNATVGEAQLSRLLSTLLFKSLLLLPAHFSMCDETVSAVCVLYSVWGILANGEEGSKNSS